MLFSGLLNFMSSRIIGETIYSTIKKGVACENSPSAAFKTMHSALQNSVNRLTFTVYNNSVALDEKFLFYAFGSSVVYGIEEHNSDLDLALLSSNTSSLITTDSTSEVEKSLQAQRLSQLLQHIALAYPEWNFNLIKRTRVPVLRVISDTCPCDITINRQFGVRNSHLLRSYIVQLPEARWLALAVKRWSKLCGFNGYPHGYLTSYAMNIMVIHYLLQQKLVTFQDPRKILLHKIPHIYDYWNNANNTEINLSMLGELSQGFLDYYIHVFDYKNKVISLSKESETTKKDLHWTMSKISDNNKVHYDFAIEDPYEINLNVGRNVTSFKLDLLKRHFKKAQANYLGCK